MTKEDLKEYTSIKKELEQIQFKLKELEERKRIEEEPRNVHKLDSLYKVYYRLQEEMGEINE